MATTALKETLNLLKQAREKSSAVVVAYSGGKDSICVLDLAMRTFERVECFFMYFVPGLECVETMLDWARERYGVKINQYPHWVLSKAIRDGVYCNNFSTVDDLEDWKLRDVYNLAKADTGIPMIMTGAKRADSLWRRRQMGTWGKSDDVVYPVAGWNKFDVLGYLKGGGLPVPDSSGKAATGIDLSMPSLLWLNDNHPRDFQKLCRVFPYAEAVVWRRKWYGA